MNTCLRIESTGAQSLAAMAKRNLFRELVSEGARLVPSLWKASGEINITAMARHYKARGYPVSQPTLQRLWDGVYDPSNATIEATYRVFGIPRELLRGEDPGENDMKQLVEGYGLPTLLIAKKLSQLPREDFDAIVTQIELAHQKAERLKALMETNPNVIPLKRRES